MELMRVLYGKDEEPTKTISKTPIPTPMEYSNVNRGTLWMEEKTFTKRDGSEGKSFSGSLNVDGKDFFLDAYPRTVTMKDGTTKDVLDLRVKPKAPRTNTETAMGTEALPF